MGGSSGLGAGRSRGAGRRHPIARRRHPDARRVRRGQAALRAGGRGLPAREPDLRSRETPRGSRAGERDARGGTLRDGVREGRTRGSAAAGAAAAVLLRPASRPVDRGRGVGSARGFSATGPGMRRGRGADQGGLPASRPAGDSRRTVHRLLERSASLRPVGRRLLQRVRGRRAASDPARRVSTRRRARAG